MENDRNLIPEGRALIARDQAWADLRKYADAIDRIAEHGPSRPEDMVVCHKVFNVVAAELRMRRSGIVE